MKHPAFLAQLFEVTGSGTAVALATGYGVGDAAGLQHVSFVYVASKQDLPAGLKPVAQHWLQHANTRVRAQAGQWGTDVTDLHGYSVVKHAGVFSQVCAEDEDRKKTAVASRM